MYNHIDRVINFALQYCIYPPAYPLEIGEIILRIYPEQDLLTSTILYSTIDHSSRKNISNGLKQIKDHFGPNTAHKISNIIKFSNYEYIAHDLTQIRKFTNELNLVDKTTNFSILLIKLASLLHSLSVFNNYYDLAQEQIKLTSLEILEVYLPLISWVDIKDVKTELQEFCTKILYPNINKDIKKYLGDIERSEEFLNNIVEDLNKELSNSQIKAIVSGRIKSYYSIWRKLHYKNTTIEKLNDIIGFRIIVDNIDDCYSALKVIHQRYQSLPEKFHDFIDVPKGNGYQSLHTVILGPKSQKLEVQIRTTEMHQVAQYGSAAHWQYKHDFTKILSVFISAQKLYTNPTVNLSTPTTVKQHNTSNVNTPIITNNIQHNTPTIHMSAIGLLAAYNKEQRANNEVATDKNQYITSLQTDYANSFIAVQPSIYGFTSLLFNFIQNNVCYRIMEFIVINNIANLVNISVEDQEYKAQEFWEDISYVNVNKQNKNSKYVSAPSKKETVAISSNSYVDGNRPKILVQKDSVVTENIIRVNITALTKIQPNANELNSEQIIQDKKQEINPIQNISNTTLWVSNTNISDNITNFYEPQLQDDSAKCANDDLLSFQLDLFNTTAVSKEEEDNTCRFERSSTDESDIVVSSTTNTEHKTSRKNYVDLSEDLVKITDNHKYIATAHTENISQNSTDITKERIIKLHRYAVKIFCAIIESKEFKKLLQSYVKGKFSSLVKETADSKNLEKLLIGNIICNLLSSYESICPENIDSIFDSIAPLETTERNISIMNELVRDIIYLGPQKITGNAIIRYFASSSSSSSSSNKPAIEILSDIDLFITLCRLYDERYCKKYAKDQNIVYDDIEEYCWVNIYKPLVLCRLYDERYHKEYTKDQNIAYNNLIEGIVISDNAYWNRIKDIMLMYEANMEINQENKDLKLINSTNKLSKNESNTGQETNTVDCVQNGDLMDVYSKFLGYSGKLNYLPQYKSNNYNLNFMPIYDNEILNQQKKERDLLRENNSTIQYVLDLLEDTKTNINKLLPTINDRTDYDKVQLMAADASIYMLDNLNKLQKLPDNVKLTKEDAEVMNFSTHDLMTELKSFFDHNTTIKDSISSVKGIMHFIDTKLQWLTCLNQKYESNIKSLDDKMYSLLRSENTFRNEDRDGNTPIFIAIREGNFPMMMLLLSFGADLNVENKSHYTPLSLAFTSFVINRSIIDGLMQEMIIKNEEQLSYDDPLSIENKKFKKFVIDNEDFRQFYNACRKYVEECYSIMIIDLLVKMNVVAPELMKNLVVGLYYKSYTDGDDEFREYLKCIGCVDTDTAEEDCNMMILNDNDIVTQPTANATVPESYSVISTEDIKKLQKCAYALQRSIKQLQSICKMMTEYLKIEGEKDFDTKGVDMKHQSNTDLGTELAIPQYINKKDFKDIERILKPLKRQLDRDLSIQPTISPNIYKYTLKTIVMMVIERNSMSDETDEKQESSSNQDLIKYYELLDKDLLEEQKKIVAALTKPTQIDNDNDDDDNESITKDAIDLHRVCTEVIKVYSLARMLIAEFVSDSKKASTEYLTKQYEEILRSTHIIKKLLNNTCTDLNLQDYSLFNKTTLPALSDTKIIPEYSITEFLRENSTINAEDKKSILAEVKEVLEESTGDAQQMNDILSYVAHKIGLENVDNILTGEQQDLN